MRHRPGKEGKWQEEIKGAADLLQRNLRSVGCSVFDNKEKVISRRGAIPKDRRNLEIENVEGEMR